MTLTPGEIVNGKYRVIRLLGDGGMGSVYEAHHEVLQTRVALKLLHAELTRTGTAKRFLQEAQASARIKSPHVVRVSDADQTPDGHAFLVLEYLEGRTLRELYEHLAREGQTLSYGDALDFAMQMFEGVEAAHAAGIVHRDLKPDNVMITADAKGGPLLKVLDFGIAKVDEPAESSRALTRPGSFLGTPEYMAPEQVYSASTADARSDVFSLGVILFEMLSGHRPVSAEDPQQIAVSYLTGAFTHLDEACPTLPPELVAAVHRALAPLPRDRFATVAEMRAAVEPFAPPRPASPSRVDMSSGVLPAPSAAAGRLSRPIPETRAHSSTVPMSAVPGPAPSPSAQAPADAVAVPSARTQMEVPAFASPSKGFVPEYPPAMAPFSLDPPNLPVAAQAPAPGFVPEYPAAMGGASYPPPPPVPAQPPAWSGWTPPVVSAPAAALQPRSRTGLWVGIVVGFLVVATAITLGALYSLGWLDRDPPSRHHKPVPAKPAPHPTATARPSTLR